MGGAFLGYAGTGALVLNAWIGLGDKATTAFLLMGQSGFFLIGTVAELYFAIRGGAETPPAAPDTNPNAHEPWCCPPP